MRSDEARIATPPEVAAGAAVYSRLVNRIYNRKSIFCNLQDGAADLEEALAKSFPRCSVTTVGAMALFTGEA